MLGVVLIATLRGFPVDSNAPLAQTSAAQISDKVAELAAAPAAKREISQAWQRAVDLGSYQYSTDVLQTTIPLATLNNMGRSSKQQAIHLAGRADLRELTMQMTLWLDGGSRHYRE